MFLPPKDDSEVDRWEASAVDEHAPDLAAQRVERAMRRFEESWVRRHDDPVSVEHALDDLDVAVGLWLEMCESIAPLAVREGRAGSALRATSPTARE